MRITDVSFLQAYAAWNLSVEELTANSSGGERKRLVKWQFYTVASEVFMSYVDKDRRCSQTCKVSYDITNHIQFPKAPIKNFHIVLCAQWKN